MAEPALNLGETFLIQTLAHMRPKFWFSVSFSIIYLYPRL